MKKYLNLLFILGLLLLTSNISKAENWVDTNAPGENSVLLDTDSIRTNSDYVFYNIKYKKDDGTLGPKEVLVITMQSDPMNNTAAYVESFTFKEYIKMENPYARIGVMQSGQMTSIESTDVIYNAHKMACDIALKNKMNISKGSNMDYNAYIQEMQGRIKMGWHPNSWNFDDVIAILRINRDGELLNYRISKSSGREDIDRLALLAIKNAAPFKPLPQINTDKTVDIELTFSSNNVVISASTNAGINALTNKQETTNATQNVFVQNYEESSNAEKFIDVINKGSSAGQSILNTIQMFGRF